MKTRHCTLLIGGLLLIAGCASNQSPVTDDVGLSEETITDAAEAADDAGTMMETVATSSDTLAVAVPGVADSDADGIGDAVDNCADTASGVLVDDRGCEIVMGPIEGLKFASNDSALNAAGKRALDTYISALKRYPEVVVSLAGYTDNRGRAADNLELSKQRVLSVAQYMAANGINPARVKLKAYGESDPIARNATADGRERNRRIEINFIEGVL